MLLLCCCARVQQVTSPLELNLLVEKDYFKLLVSIMQSSSMALHRNHKAISKHCILASRLQQAAICLSCRLSIHVCT